MLTQEQINSLTVRFQRAEWQWLISLPREIKCAMAGGNERDYDPAAFAHYGEFFLTLAGIKPCLLLTNPEYPRYAHDLYEHAIQPIQHELQGFELFSIDRDDQCSEDGTQPQVVYIFTSRFHPKFSLIKEVLMKPHHAPVPNELLGKALGYPVPSGMSTFYYVDETTTKELGCSCMVVFEFTARSGFERSIKMHFERCAAEFRKLGKVLTFSSS
jgi:hypothetical protein